MSRFRTKLVVRAIWLFFGCVPLGSTFAQFNTVLNIPPDELVEPRFIGSNTQVNLFDGGSFRGGVLGFHFNVGEPDGTGSNVELNVFGGSMQFPKLNSGSVVNIFGGNTLALSARHGSQVRIEGGIHDGMEVSEGGQVTIVGGEFRLNGESVSDVVPGQSMDIREVVELSGTLMDGTPFSLNRTSGRLIDGVVTIEPFHGSITLESVDLPPIQSGITILGTSEDHAPPGIRSGQTLVLRGDAEVRPRFTAISGSTLSVEGGSVLGGIDAVGATINVSSGEVKAVSAFDDTEFNITGGFVGRISANSGSIVRASGGTIDAGFRAGNDSLVEISGGIIGDDFRALAGSTVDITGGTMVRGRFEANDGSKVNISGGDFRTRFAAGSGSEVNLIGTEFLLDGNLIQDLIPGESLLLPNRGGVLTGTFLGGQDFSFRLDASFFASDAALTVTRVVPEPNSHAITITALLACWTLARTKSAATSVNDCGKHLTT